MSSGWTGSCPRPSFYNFDYGFIEEHACRRWRPHGRAPDHRRADVHGLPRLGAADRRPRDARRERLRLQGALRRARRSPPGSTSTASSRCGRTGWSRSSISSRPTRSSRTRRSTSWVGASSIARSRCFTRPRRMGREQARRPGRSRSSWVRSRRRPTPVHRGAAGPPAAGDGLADERARRRQGSQPGSGRTASRAPAGCASTNLHAHPPVPRRHCRGRRPDVAAAMRAVADAPASRRSRSRWREPVPFRRIGGRGRLWIGIEHGADALAAMSSGLTELLAAPAGHPIRGRSGRTSRHAATPSTARGDDRRRRARPRGGRPRACRSTSPGGAVRSLLAPGGGALRAASTGRASRLTATRRPVREPAARNAVPALRRGARLRVRPALRRSSMASVLRRTDPIRPRRVADPEGLVQRRGRPAGRR